MVVAIALRCVPRPVSIPGRTGGVEWVLVPVAPAFLCGLVPAIVLRASMPLERVSGRFAASGRTALVVIGVMLTSASVAVGVGHVRLADVRNCAFTVGVALVSSRVTPPALAWAPVVLVGVTNWLLGAPLPGEQPPAWAVLLQSASSTASLWVASAVLALGAAVFVLVPPAASDHGER